MESQVVIWITIAVYIVLMLALGIVSSRKSTDISNFTVGKRNAGAWLTAISYGTAYFSAVMFVGYAGGSGWNYGIWAILIGIGNAVLGSLVAWKLLASRTRKVSHTFDIQSMPQMFRVRYGSERMKKFAAVVIFVFLLPYSASVYKGLASICSVLLKIDPTLCMLIIAAMSALLLVVGGYLATIKADFFQGIIMVFGVALLIFFVLRSDVVVNGGSFSGLWKAMEQSGVQPMGKTKWIALLSTVFMTSVGTWGLPQMIHKYYGIKDEKEIKRGTVISTLFALLVAGGGYLIGSFAHLFFSAESLTEIGGVDFAVPNILKMSNLPTVLMGVVLVLLISASVSTLSSVALSACTTVSMDLIGDVSKKIKPTVFIKILCVVFVALSYLVANTNTPILDMMSYSWGILSGSFLAPYMLALYCKRMNKVSAWSGMLTGFFIALIPAVCKVMELCGITAGGVKSLAALGPQFACLAMVLSFIVCLVVAGFNKKQDNNEFYVKSGI